MGPAIDVFEAEPLPPEHAVRRLDNVVATPHIGYVSCDLYRVRRPVANIADRLRWDPERRHLRGGQLGCAAKQKFAWASTRRRAEGSLVAVLRGWRLGRLRRAERGKGGRRARRGAGQASCDSGFMRGLAKDVASDGITANAVLPGLTNTLATAPQSEEQNRATS